MKIATREGALDRVKTSFLMMGLGLALFVISMLGDGGGGLGGIGIGGVVVPVPVPSGGNPFDLLLAGAGFVSFGLGIGQLATGLYWLVRNR